MDTRAVLADFVAGRARAERVVAAAVAAYYGEGGRGKREALRPLMDVIERAAPGVVELAGGEGKPGFAVKPAERPFPKAEEGALRRAAETVLAGWPADQRVAETREREVDARGGWWARAVQAVRRLFSA